MMGKWSKATRKGAKGSKEGQKWRPQQVTVRTSCNDDDKEADRSNEEYVASAERDFKHQVRWPNEHFTKLLEVAYPNHEYPMKHKLKECTMMKNFLTSGALSMGKKPEGDQGKRGMTPFPREEVVMSIYSGPVTHESRRKVKLMSWEVNTMSPATPEYLRWSKSLITFDQTDHLNCVPMPGRFPS
jgi:hypothetical protein